MAELESGHRGEGSDVSAPTFEVHQCSSTLRVFPASEACRRDAGRPRGRDAHLVGGLVYDSLGRRATPASPALGFGDRPIRDKSCRQTPDLTSSLDNIRII